MRKSANIDFDLCAPSRCDHAEGVCRAALACAKGLLEQEGRFEAPFLISSRLCSGCGKCVKTCPLNAIEIIQGM